ncbi:Enoyl-CoA hydratase/isomerase, putative [Candida maltosa Xu316]|uniref:Enoyl-CoA hydratase/isomerase, putative n=1 Tax=Candida maltosa (strain Xu316) TaxID=1245528 RepID=M3JRN6_CANMX|nr:Enoyl-CoA hydratase/isomerase, putative [Candida maltosa Xu316]
MPFDANTYKKYQFYTVSQIEPGFVHVTYTNPKTLNAYNDQNWRDFGEIFTRLDKEDDVQLILFTSGVPRSFSSGLNLKEAAGLLNKQGPREQVTKEVHKHILEFQDCIGAPYKISTPTIGILNGLNLGLALDISSGFSIRIAVADAQFSIAEVNIGIAADIGSLQRLPPLFNNKSALMQHALLGDRFDAQEALKLGFVSTVVPTIEDGIALAKTWGEKICDTPAWAIKGTKKHIQDILNGGTVEQGLKDIAEYNAFHIVNSKSKL